MLHNWFLTIDRIFTLLISLFQIKLRQQMLAIENDPTIEPMEKSKRKQNLLLLHNLNSGNGTLSPHFGSSSGGSAPPTPPSTMSPNAPSFYPAGDIVDSVVGGYPKFDLLVCT